mgnify:CR=1 FL=1
MPRLMDKRIRVPRSMWGFVPHPNLLQGANWGRGHSDPGHLGPSRSLNLWSEAPLVVPNPLMDGQLVLSRFLEVV